MAKQARILVDISLDGQQYTPDQVVEFTNKTAKNLQDAGQVDSDPSAIDYCVKELGTIVIKHVSTDAAAADTAE